MNISITNTNINNNIDIDTLISEFIIRKVAWLDPLIVLSTRISDTNVTLRCHLSLIKVLTLI